MIYPIILCGGSGTRLWPLSRKAFPKQFIPLLGEKSLLQLTLERVAPLTDGREGSIYCVSAEDHRFLLADVAAHAGLAVRQILEPQPKNTAAAMTLAALATPADAILPFCPADHHLPHTQSFVDTVRSAVPAAKAGRLVTFGVMPTHPSTAYGYIQKLPGDAKKFCSPKTRAPAFPLASSTALKIPERPNLNLSKCSRVGIWVKTTLCGWKTPMAASLLRPEA